MLTHRISLLARTAACLVAIAASPAALAVGEHMTGLFAGAKVNGGTVTHMTKGGQSMLMLSDDFKVPETPDPHWQVVDSEGNVYTLQKLSIKGGNVNRTIVVPSYVKDVAKVQIWCSWAEALLGEASFSVPVK